MDTVDVITDKQRQVTAHARGKPHPPVPRHLQAVGVTHLLLHEGIVPGQTVNYHLEPNLPVTCELVYSRRPSAEDVVERKRQTG